jgi:hypothetical protein
MSFCSGNSSEKLVACNSFLANFFSILTILYNVPTQTLNK